MKKKMTVYNLIMELGRVDIPTDEVVDLLGNYPVLSHMILTDIKDVKRVGVLLEIMRVLPEVSCETVESRLRKYPSGKEVKVRGIVNKDEGKKTNVSRETSSEPEKSEREEGNPGKETQGRKPVQKQSTSTSKRRVEVEDNGDIEYEKLSVVKCYELCKKRGIPCKTKQKKEFYIELLLEYDNGQEGYEVEDEWEGVE